METPTPLSVAQTFRSIELILNGAMDLQVPVRVTPAPASWRILYDEHELKTLFYDLVKTFAEIWLGPRKRQWSGMLRIAFKAEEHHAAVLITMLGVRITPREWERFFNRFRDFAC